MPEEKQQEIFETSLEEFVTHGYDSASTNRIVERAGISKGVLFKYFSNKESLFRYVANRCIDILEQSFDVTPEEMPDDFFAGFRYLVSKEILLLHQHPRVFALFEKMRVEKQHPLYQRVMEESTSRGQTMYARLFSALSTKKLREDIPLDHAFAIVQWVIEGFNRQIVATYQESGIDQLESLSEKLLKELDLYFDLLKEGLCKKE